MQDRSPRLNLRIPYFFGTLSEGIAIEETL
jgi:hypothetical protein